MITKRESSESRAEHVRAMPSREQGRALLMVGWCILAWLSMPMSPVCINSTCLEPLCNWIGWAITWQRWTDMRIFLTGATGYVGEGTLLELQKVDAVEKPRSMTVSGLHIKRWKVNNISLLLHLYSHAGNELFPRWEQKYSHAGNKIFPPWE